MISARFTNMPFSTVIVFSVFIPIVTSAPSVLEPDTLWTCPTSPVECIPQSPSIKPWDLCTSDANCTGGDRCCYHGCIRRCIGPNPCDRVVCEKGFTCHEETTICDSEQCPKQANCIAEEQTICPTLRCSNPFCPPGFQRRKDINGCDTCGCQRKKECGPLCSIYCAFGHVMKDGCPTCECLPEPDGPCTNVSCASNEECRLVETSCEVYPCLPQPTCVPVVQLSRVDTCGMLLKTLSGRPVMDPSRHSEVNCSSTRCPDHTVCAAMEEGLFLCCWQYTQSRVSGSPKLGNCPQLFLADFHRTMTQCEIDADCPGQEKCCYRDKSAGKSRHVGACMLPEHVHLQKTGLCERSSYLTDLLTFLHICPGKVVKP